MNHEQKPADLENKEAAAKVAEENKAAAESTTEGNGADASTASNKEIVDNDPLGVGAEAQGEAKEKPTDEPKEKPDTYHVNGSNAA